FPDFGRTCLDAYLTHSSPLSPRSGALCGIGGCQGGSPGGRGPHVLMGRDLDCPQFRIQSGFEVRGGNLLTAGGTPPSLFFLATCHAASHCCVASRLRGQNPFDGPILLCEHFPALCIGIAHVGCPKVRAGCPISRRAFSPRGLRAHQHERRPLRGLFPCPTQCAALFAHCTTCCSLGSFIRCHRPRIQRLATAATATHAGLPRALSEAYSLIHRASLLARRWAAWISVARSSRLHPSISPASAWRFPVLALQGESPQ